MKTRRFLEGATRLAFLVSLTGSLAVLTGCPDLFPPPAGNGNENVNDNTGGDNANDNFKGDSGLTGQYAGSARCQLCHSNQHADWSDTLHAHALEALEAIGEDDNPNCVQCHVTGFGQPGGWQSRELTNSLAGVGCESCHGPSAAHASNASDRSLRPPKSIASEVCQTCHNAAGMAPHFENWSDSRHSAVTETVAEEFNHGIQLNNCGKCHSGDYFYRALLEGETLADNALAGVDPHAMMAVECAICHDPHRRTGHAANPDSGRDYQLRFPEATYPTPTNTIDAVTNTARFNLCGQCHHDRGRTWRDTARPPHPSNQVNFYLGEMPNPADIDASAPLVASSGGNPHVLIAEQCARCHMVREDFLSPAVPEVFSRHTMQVDYRSCAPCHQPEGAARLLHDQLKGGVQARLTSIANRLGAPATWEYTANGGPNSAGQRALSDEIKQIRFLYYYVLEDGSFGTHNPTYVDDCLDKAEQLLTQIGR